MNSAEQSLLISDTSTTLLLFLTPGEEEDMMAPQVMLDENGEVVINEHRYFIDK